MKTQSHDEKYNRFWFGFALGSVVCGATALALGTKQGRKTVKKAVDFMEKVETEPDQIEKVVNTIYSFYGSLVSGSQPSGTKPSAVHKDSSETEQTTLESAASGISDVIEKMKSMSSDGKKEKKFFTKTKK